jgi:hypothetical protein
MMAALLITNICSHIGDGRSEPSTTGRPTPADGKTHSYVVEKGPRRGLRHPGGDLFAEQSHHFRVCVVLVLEHHALDARVGEFA